MAAAPAPAPPLTMEQVRAAQELLRDIVPESRLVASAALSKENDGSVHLKLECEGPTGSFKVRGAYHAIKTHKMPLGGELPGVITASTGNHGAAVAYAASQLRIPARIYLPENPNPAKRARIAQLGAEIVEVGKYLEDTREHAAKFSQQSGWYNVVDGVDAAMLPGTATIACEILDKLPQADVIFVPVGDSTLIRGLAFAAKTDSTASSNRRRASRTRSSLCAVIHQRPRDLHGRKRHDRGWPIRPRRDGRQRQTDPGIGG